MASKKTRIIVGLVAVAVVGTIVAVNVTRDSRNKIVVQTQKVGRHDLVTLVSASGEVKPKRYVNVSANVSGRITHLMIKEGDPVRKGQILARIDSTRFEAENKQTEAGVQAQKAELQRSLAELEVARLNFERTAKMHEQKLVSDQVRDQAEADFKSRVAGVDSTRRRITQQEAMLDSSRDNLEKTTVISPMDGVVTLLQKEEGEVVIGAQSFSPTVIMTVADLSIMECEIMVDETDIRNVKLGQVAEIRVDALEGTKVKGEVTEIGSSAIVRGSTGTAVQASTNTGNQAKDFKVTITLKEPPVNLRPGLNATADITTARKENALSVPIQAVVAREVDKDGKIVDPNDPKSAKPDESASTTTVDLSVKQIKAEERDGVFVVKNGVATFKPVKTGTVGETDIEVLEGVGEGDEIVSGSYRTLRSLKDQAKIKLETKEKKKA